MPDTQQSQIDGFIFRDLHPGVSMGTASDRYAGWLGQIYSEARYQSQMTSRTTKIGGQSLIERVLPVSSVAEYFQHFSVLELDFTFYGWLADPHDQPTPTFRTLSLYKEYLAPGNRLLLKVPQAVFARKFWRSGKYIDNPDYLNPDMFTCRFYRPAVELLGEWLHGFIFEQEYQIQKERSSTGEFCARLDDFFTQIPPDERYHVEVRTESFLSPAYFDLLEKHSLGQVLSHWTWLPPLSRQFALGRSRFLNSGRQCLIRLLTPPNVKYEDAYLRTFPFDKMVEGLLSPRMIEDTVAIMRSAIDQGCHINVAVNNRAGCNAPTIAQLLSKRFLDSLSDPA
ncbi:MAG: DUF72 domain-containing protein [Deltaproteobacteria bacterium]|nr:DUF72 domain-containing protein [Deltaproteobacteria bacterium]